MHLDLLLIRLFKNEHSLNEEKVICYELELLTFRLNAPVVIRVKVKKCEQTGAMHMEAALAGCSVEWPWLAWLAQMGVETIPLLL